MRQTEHVILTSHWYTQLVYQPMRGDDKLVLFMPLLCLDAPL